MNMIRWPVMVAALCLMSGSALAATASVFPCVIVSVDSMTYDSGYLQAEVSITNCGSLPGMFEIDTTFISPDGWQTEEDPRTRAIRAGTTVEFTSYLDIRYDYEPGATWAFTVYADQMLWPAYDSDTAEYTLP